MDRVLNLVGKSSGDIYMLHYPASILRFCDYDLAYFAENAVEVCSEALRSGTADHDRITEIRNSISGVHVYVSNHIRTTYDKIVLDCWIDYVCRRDNVGTGALWNRFIECKTPFEKEVLLRLSDFRYGRAINEWLNLVRVQDYARTKLNFIFSRELKSAKEAAARRSYFDLIFSVTARELGCRSDELGVTKMFSSGRAPSSPFMFPNVSRDIIKNVLSDFNYDDDYSDIMDYGENPDQIAMDVFSRMKSGLAQEIDSYNNINAKIEGSPNTVFMPYGLKAVVDLELDALIASGGWLSHCRRCGRFFLKDAEHSEDYCSHPNPGGMTCLERYYAENPKPLLPPELERGCREVKDEMYARVDKTMSLAEYEKWHSYMEALRVKVENGEIPAEELADFLKYSQTVDLTRSHPLTNVPKRPPEPPRERVVRPFMPERISRSEIPAPRAENTEEEPEAPRARREGGFFTSPGIERKKTISHIIRDGEPRGSNRAPTESRSIDNGQRAAFRPFDESAAFPPFPQEEFAPRAESAPYPAPRDSRAFPPFPQEEFAPRAESAPYPAPRDSRAFPPFPQEDFAPRSESAAYPAQRDSRAFPPFPQEDFAPRAESAPYPAPRDSRAFPPFPQEDFAPRAAESDRAAVWVGEDRTSDSPRVRYIPTERPAQEPAPRDSRAFPQFSQEEFAQREGTPSPQRNSGYGVTERDNSPHTEAERQPAPQGFVGFAEDYLPAEALEPAAPAPKVIRRNAAAISAYGKMANPVTIEPESDPYKDVGNIFDMLIQSENEPVEQIDLTDIPAKNAVPVIEEPRATSPERSRSSAPVIEEPRATVPERSRASAPVIEEPRATVPERSRNSAPVIEEPRATAPERSRASAPVIEEPRAAAPESSRTSPQPARPEERPVPSGIWTEPRGLFPDDEGDDDGQSELDMLKEKKRARSNKTRRLFDVIMREPDDNPNMRGKH